MLLDSFNAIFSSFSRSFSFPSPLLSLSPSSLLSPLLRSGLMETIPSFKLERWF